MLIKKEGVELRTQSRAVWRRARERCAGFGAVTWEGTGSRKALCGCWGRADTVPGEGGTFSPLWWTGLTTVCLRGPCRDRWASTKAGMAQVGEASPGTGGGGGGCIVVACGVEVVER